jgi:ABC-type antimicrobial peptide transport system permease subunit
MSARLPSRRDLATLPSFSFVEERRREIGIRLALGASRAGIGRALFQASRGAVSTGLGGGLALSLIAGLFAPATWRSPSFSSPPRSSQRRCPSGGRCG